MKATRLFLSMTTLALVAGFTSNADAILVDFDSLAVGANLKGVDLGGVTLTTLDSSIIVHDKTVGFGVSVGSHSGDNAILSGAGTNGFPQSNPLEGVFDTLVTSVSLWAGDNFSDVNDDWTLTVFDMGGTPLGSVSTTTWNGDPYMELTLSFAGIKSFEATSTSGVGYDSLSFTPVPEPGAVGFGIIACIGLVVGGVFRSKKEK